MPTTIHPDTLLLYKEKVTLLEKILNITKRIIDEEITESQACKEAGVNQMAYRNFIRRNWAISNNDMPYKAVAPIYSSKEEEFLKTLYDTDDVCVLKDFNKIYNHVTQTFLTPKEADILTQYYMQKKTMNEIGIEYGFSRENVRQFLNRTKRKLRRKEVYDLFMYGLEYQDVKTDIDEIVKQSNESKINKIKEQVIENLTDSRLMIPILKISDLGLSVRSYNCLRKAGINTLKDLSKLSISDLNNIPYLGRKCLDEIIGTLKYYGLEPVWDLD